MEGLFDCLFHAAEAMVNEFHFENTLTHPTKGINIHARGLLAFFALCSLIRWFTVKPKAYECNPSGDGHPNAGNPYPTRSDFPAPRPLIMCKMANGNLSLDVDIG